MVYFILKASLIWFSLNVSLELLAMKHNTDCFVVHLQKMSSLVDKTTKAWCKLMHHTNTGPNAISETSATHRVYKTISGNLLEINRFKSDDANNLLIVLSYTQFPQRGCTSMISSILLVSKWVNVCVVCTYTFAFHYLCH